MVALAPAWEDCFDVDRERNLPQVSRRVDRRANANRDEIPLREWSGLLDTDQTDDVGSSSIA